MSGTLYMEESRNLQDTDRRRFGNLIVEKPVILEDDHKAVLRFLLGGEKMYMRGDSSQSAPFIPEYKITFKKRRDTVSIVISLSGGFLKLYYRDRYIKTLKYTREYFMIRFLSLISDEESLKELMNLQTPE